jgi:hypothetical protein
VDQLFLNAVGFPVASGIISRSRDQSSAHSWCIEIQCEETPQLDYRNWPDDRDEQDSDWLAGAKPYLYAQMLPLPVDSPDELVGQTYSFPQSPGGNPSDWDRGVGWLFFCLYINEHDLVYPTTITFTERQEKRYRARISSSYPAGRSPCELRVEAWLDWVE